MEEKSSIKCPVCGSEFILNNASSQHISSGAFGKRIKALSEAGIDTDTVLKVLNSVLGGGCDIDISDNADCKTINAITEYGTVPNRKLFRRWITAQVFHGIASWKGFTQSIHDKGFWYQWRMLADELLTQSKLYIKDEENYTMRHKWFNQQTVAEICYAYYNNFVEFVEKQGRHNDKQGNPFIKIGNKKYLLSDIDELKANMSKAVCDIKCSNSPSQLHKAYLSFYVLIIKYKNNLKLVSPFISAYKGAGAYFTMRNLILFHGCMFNNLSQQESLRYLDIISEEHKNAAWRMFGVLREFIDTNNIDIEAKILSWHKNR